jgi:hypothetical protein
MSDTLEGAMHQKHETLLAEHGSEIKALHRGQDEMRGDIKTILSAVQSNNKSGISSVVTCAGLALTFLIGFMTLVILPMQEATDKRRIEQDGKNKRQSIINEGIARESGRHEVSEEHYEAWLQVHSTELKVLHTEVSANAIAEARFAGELKGRIDCIENQVNAIDYTGPRGATK